jgi:NAD(P)-dependent dehydrogenase (short-subunit alcohol dehydrogenase family)
VTDSIVPAGHAGKVALVTGAARGIGYAIARVLAHDGANVALLDQAENVSDSARKIKEETCRATFGIVADVTKDADIDRAFATAEQELGDVSILVNNAAITTNVDRIVKMSAERFARDLDVNLTGTFRCTQRALPKMIEREWGRIVNISSGAAELGSFGQAGYSASKAGILGLTRSTALEYARKGITCNALLPGLIDAPAADSIRGDMRERIAQLIPTRRLGTPEEVAYAASWLASSRASYVNGASLFVSSGQELFVF